MQTVTAIQARIAVAGMILIGCLTLIAAKYVFAQEEIKNHKPSLTIQVPATVTDSELRGDIENAFDYYDRIGPDFKKAKAIADDPAAQNLLTKKIIADWLYGYRFYSDRWYGMVAEQLLNEIPELEEKLKKATAERDEMTVHGLQNEIEMANAGIVESIQRLNYEKRASLCNRLSVGQKEKSQCAR
jgi:hypothetical protein